MLDHVLHTLKEVLIHQLVTSSRQARTAATPRESFIGKMTSTMTKDLAPCAVEIHANKEDIIGSGKVEAQLEDQKDDPGSGKDNVGENPKIGTEDITPKEEKPQNKAKKKKKIPFQRKSKQQAQTSEVLNLNNEVVKMRKEVKRVRALISRKVVRQMANLKKKKGKEEEMKKNERRAARLLEEIHAMKKVSPDVVTKTALQKNLNFEAVCKNPKSSITDRAVARIATHPQIKKRIDEIKAAVKSFKAERMSEGKNGERKEKAQKDSKRTVQLPDNKNSAESKVGEEEEGTLVEQEERTDTNEEPVTCIVVAKTFDIEEKLPAPLSDHNIPDKPKSSPNIQKRSEVVKCELQPKALETKPAPTPPSDTLLTKAGGEEEESDLSDNEEKQYFDDSTEERFHKQSSLSECSDSEDDFFIGKVSKFRKKKKKNATEGSSEKHKAKEESTDKSDGIQSELDELESRLKSKPTKLQSVFCSSLSQSKPSRGRAGKEVRGGGPILKKDIQKGTKVYVKQNKLVVDRTFKFTAGVRGTGRGGFPHKDRGGVVSHQASQPALHPSWEASKRRKEQQGQIQAFQGKKIKFDDSD